MSEFVTNLNKIDKIKPSNALQTLKNEIFSILFENLNQILLLGRNDATLTNFIIVPIIDILKKEICPQVTKDIYHVYQEEKQTNSTPATT